MDNKYNDSLEERLRIWVLAKTYRSNIDTHLVFDRADANFKVSSKSSGDIPVTGTITIEDDDTDDGYIEVTYTLVSVSPLSVEAGYEHYKCKYNLFRSVISY